jgi:hypothetical protein
VSRFIVVWRLELVDALELVAQLPEPPLIADGAFVCCVLEVLLQLNITAALGVFTTKNVAATNIAPTKY